MILLILISAGLVSCKDNTPVDITGLVVTTQPQTPTPSGPGSYPPPSNAYPYPYPSETPLSPYAFTTTSEAGKITIHGNLIVLDFVLMAPGPNDAIFLVPIGGGEGTISTIPYFTMGEVPQAEVDERTGEFYFTNIEPGQYAVVVLTTGDAQIPVRKWEDSTLAIFRFAEEDRDQTIELGDLTLP